MEGRKKTQARRVYWRGPPHDTDIVKTEAGEVARRALEEQERRRHEEVERRLRAGYMRKAELIRKLTNAWRESSVTKSFVEGLQKAFNRDNL